MKLTIVSTKAHGEKGYLPFGRLAKKSGLSDVTFVDAGEIKTILTTMKNDISNFRDIYVRFVS